MQEVKRWKPRSAYYVKTLEYLKGRMNGSIRSMKTPWERFNDAGTDGIEWGTTLIIGGRPGAYKTTFKDKIVNSARALNPIEEFRVLDFSFEMLMIVTLIRELCAETGKTYKELCSAGNPLAIDILNRCYNYLNQKAKDKENNIDVVEDACTINEFIEIVEEYMEFHKKEVPGKDEKGNDIMITVYPKVMIGIDHTRLFKRSPFEGSEEEMISNLGKAVTYLKRKYYCIFIVLSQLNRDIDRPERNEDAKIGNYPTSSDLFGSDAMYQHGDIVAIINRPSLKNIRFYGPNRYIVQEDPFLLALHFLKARNGDSRLSFFRADEKMNIHEVEHPPMAQKKGEDRNN